jgi:hypothetical protein
MNGLIQTSAGEFRGSARDERTWIDMSGVGHKGQSDKLAFECDNGFATGLFRG